MKIYRTAPDKNRKAQGAEDEEKTKRLVRNSMNKLLKMVVGHENFQIHEAESNLSKAIHDAIPKSLGMSCKSKAAVG